MAAKRRTEAEVPEVSRVWFPAGCRLDRATAREMDGGRFTLEAVALEGGWLVATNGRILVRVRAEVEGPLAAPDAGRVLIPAGAIRAAIEAADGAGRATFEVLEEDGGSVRVRYGDGEERWFPPVVGAFPRTAELVPERSGDDFTVSFNVDYLRDLLAALGSAEFYDGGESWVRLVVRRDAFELDEEDGRADLAKAVRVELGGWSPVEQDDERSVAVCVPVTGVARPGEERSPAPRLLFPCDETKHESSSEIPASGKD